MASTLRITDGVSAVDFLASDGIYRVTSWAPAVAGRRVSAIGGRGPYEDVTEVMEISVKGAGAAQSLESLLRLLDQATRWAAGEPVDAVVLQFKPTATSDTLQATILGPASPGEPMVELPENVVNAAALGMIEPVVLRFRRMGVWLGASVSKTSTGGTQNPAVNTVSGLTWMNTACPFILRLEELPGREDIISDSFILVSSGTNATTADRIFVEAAWNMAGTSSNFDDVADTGTNSVANKVLRFEATTANVTYDSDVLTPTSSELVSSRRYVAFINRRNNSTSATFQVRLRVFSATVRGTVFTPWVTVLPKSGTTSSRETGDPLYMMLGVVSTPGPISNISLQARSDTAGATLDFDSIALMALDNEDGDRVLAILRGDGTPVTFTSADFNINHRLLSDPTPAASFDTAGGLVQPYRGDISLWLPAGHTVVRVAWLGTRSQGITPGRWRAVTTGGSVPTTFVTVIQSRAYLIPR